MEEELVTNEESIKEGSKSKEDELLLKKFDVQVKKVDEGFASLPFQVRLSCSYATSLATPRAAVLVIVPPRLLLTLPPGNISVASEFRARPGNLAQASRTCLSESGGGEVSSPKRAGVLASANVIEFSPKRRGTHLSESPSRLSETPWPERPVWARVRASWVFTSLLFCVWCAIVHNSLESLGETFRVALQWLGRNSMAPLEGEQLESEQRYPPQVWASAESDQVIREVSSPKRAGVLASANVIEFSPKRRGTHLSESPSRLSETPWPERPVWARVRASWVFTSLLFCVWCAIVHNSLESLGETFRVALQWLGRNSMAPLEGEQLESEQRYPPQVWASAESDQVIRIRMSRVES
ncbi:hypothetical protein DEO72_LG2g1521 [Vigna unguiculata]|uniref:Uncharacterized protein n=1 Tax=Vigna unguiculata TaxID=3917 RepID=A0A4D6KT21_VIGUN|nr:hypothetical protein DEO72_LG2g1521 [Vigna unguiculata]